MLTELPEKILGSRGNRLGGSFDQDTRPKLSVNNQHPQRLLDQLSFPEKLKFQEKFNSLPALQQKFVASKLLTSTSSEYQVDYYQSLFVCMRHCIKL